MPSARLMTAYIKCRESYGSDLARLIGDITSTSSFMTLSKEDISLLAAFMYSSILSHGILLELPPQVYISDQDAYQDPKYSSLVFSSPKRLRFIGDSYFSLFASSLYFQQYPAAQNGGLTQLTSQVKSKDVHALAFTVLGLDRHAAWARAVQHKERVIEQITGACVLLAPHMAMCWASLIFHVMSTSSTPPQISDIKHPLL